jgi:hypothetical protein
MAVSGIVKFFYKIREFCEKLFFLFERAVFLRGVKAAREGLFERAGLRDAPGYNEAFAFEEQVPFFAEGDGLRGVDACFCEFYSWLVVKKSR